MEEASIVSISELLRLGRPLTGAASLSPHPFTPRSSTASFSPSSKRTPAETAFLPEREPIDPSTFRPLSIPVLLVGTLALSGDEGSQSCVSRGHCFSFSDGSARVCCAILDLDITVIGREMHILAWNFLPLPRGGGLLEIIRWCLPNQQSKCREDPFPSAPPCFPQLEDRSRARSCAWGVLLSVSPVFSVPLTVHDGDCQGDPHREPTADAHSVGFLAEVRTCKCDPCTEARSVEDLHRCLQGRNVHSFDQQVFVYFRGSSSLWRPLLFKLVGNVVTVSSLRKKNVSGGGRELLVFATTERTIVYTNTKPVDNRFVKRRAHLVKGQLGTYTGVVTGVFKKGMVVELDKKDVWLLFTDPLLDLPHSFRVGAVIIVKNVHFIRPNFLWVRILLLGSCVRTTVEIKSFSPVDTRCHFMNRSHSLLWDFIDSLPLSARFWVLLLISSFQKKFAGIFSDKEILGSKKKEGLVQTYCKSLLPSIMYEDQQGVFDDFCKHDVCYLRNNLNNPPLKLVVPLSNFITKCKTIWISLLPQVQVDSETRKGNNNLSLLYCEGKCHCRMIRQIISSEELGLVLVGSLQVSPSSGRLQLVDSTGCINVVIPDLSLNFDQHVMYEVKDYTLVIGGFPVQPDSVLLHRSDPISCRSILQHFQVHEELEELIIYAHFYNRNLKHLRTPLSCPVFRTNEALGSSSGDFHLLLVTHKFLHIQNLPGHSSAFAEAIFLPYNLILLGMYQDIQPSEFCERHERADGIPCLVTFTDVTYLGHLVPYNLSHRGGKTLDILVDKHGVQRVLLEFKSGSINRHQLLHIGTYYILKRSKDLSYGIKGHAEFLDAINELVTSETCLWSLNFSLGKLMQPCMQQQDQLSEASALRVLCQGEKLFHHCADTINEKLDAHLCLSNRAIELPNTTKLLEDCLNKAHKIIGEEFSVSSFTQVMTSVLLHPSGSVNHQGRLPEGNLISLKGNILDVHLCHQNHQDGRAEWSHKCSGCCTICIHVHEGHHLVKVRGTFSISAYPLGMGPGANATFHRVLTMLASCRQYELLIVPVSFIVVNYVEQLDILCNSRNLFSLPNCSISSSNVYTQNGSLPVASSTLISELIDYSLNTVVRLHCRVTGTFILLLKEQVDEVKNLQSAQKLKMPTVKIALAGFKLDDGSSTCCCWADSDRAEMLLQLQETVFQSFVGRHGTSRVVGNNQNQVTVGFLVQKILKKHRRIILRNYGAKIDSSLLDITFSVDSNNALTSLEEDVLRFIVLNAQNGPNMDVIGYMLNPNELPWSEELTEADFAGQSLKHLWVEEVARANLLMEGRNLVNELLPR